MNKIDINPTKLLSIGAAIIGLAGGILSKVLEKRQRSELKEEITKEVLDSLLKKD